MHRLGTLTLLLPLLVSSSHGQTQQVFGYRDFTQQAKWDTAFLAVPDPTLAGQHLKTLTAAPHWASSPEDYATATYVADKFKAAGLQTEIVPYKVLLNKPISILIEAFDANGNQLMSGPTPEHVDSKRYGGDPFQNDPRILPAFNGSSPSADVTGEVVYANYGDLADFKKLASMGISVKDKIVIVRYGANFRGVKVYSRSNMEPKVSSSTLTPPTMATTAATSTRRVPIVPRPAFSAAPFSSFPSIPAIPRRLASHRPPTFPTPSAFRSIS